MTYAAAFFCQSCGEPITYQKHKRSGHCDKCLDHANHKRSKKFGALPAGFYTEVTPSGCWCCGMIYNKDELFKALRDDAVRLGALMEYWAPGMREITVLYNVVPHGAAGLALVRI